jgi:hypothetical protein
VQQNTGAAGWTPTPNSGIEYTLEDQHASYLNPGYGGQAYDAEALYAVIAKDADNSYKLFIALATGHNPNTLDKPSANSYGAGDFAIDFGKDGSYELGINIKHTINTSGGKESFGIEGGVYDNAQWALGLWNSAGGYAPGNPDDEQPTHLIGGDLLGMANLAYTTVGQTGFGQWASDTHYFYEMSIGLDLLTGAGWKGEGPSTSTGPRIAPTTASWSTRRPRRCRNPAPWRCSPGSGGPDRPAPTQVSLIQANTRLQPPTASRIRSREVV